MSSVNRYAGRGWLKGLVASAFLLTVGASVLVASPQQKQEIPKPPADPASQYHALVSRYCVTCHNSTLKTAGLLLDQADMSNVKDHPEIWEKVIWRLRTATMPPIGMPRPKPDDAQDFAAWLETSLDAQALAHPNPGHPLIHRLNRAEYGNAIRDLLDLNVDVTSLLPGDSSSHGFDNMADVLKVSPLLLERYLSAAMKISSLAVGDPNADPDSKVVTIPLDRSQASQVEGLPDGTRGGTLVPYDFPLTGEYQLKATLFRVNSGGARGIEGHDQPFEFQITVDGVVVHSAEIAGKQDDESSYENPGGALAEAEKRMQASIPITAGPHSIGFTFVRKDFAVTQDLFQVYQPSSQDPGDPTGLPQLDTVTIQGPFNAKGPGDTPSRRRVFVCYPKSPGEQLPCARKILSTLARRAYRRPVTEAELDRLVKWFEEGTKDGGFEHGIEMAIPPVLASPSFLFRYENDPKNVEDGSSYRISDVALASRLSFFLWSSIPDDQLLDLAIKGKLRKPGVLEAQVKRMLGDPRSDALSQNFVDQWLFLRNLNSAMPDHVEFPNVDEGLRDDFTRETNMFFESIVHEDHSVLDLLNADYTFMNERLAKHYGIKNVYGPEFRRVTIADPNRRGLLGQASILTLTSAQTRTSPVLRGKWILTNIFNTPPPAPPPNVPAFPSSSNAHPTSVRDRLEMHRKVEPCATCHRTIDPPGFALENFNATGQWRAMDAGAKVDATGVLADGTKLDGPIALRNAILSRPETFVGTMTQKLMTYALGRGLEPYDMPSVRAVVRNAKADDYRFSSIVIGIVQSVPFQMKMKEAAGPPAATPSGTEHQAIKEPAKAGQEGTGS